MHDKGGGLLEWLDIETFYLIFAEGWAFYAENPVIAEDTDIYQDDIMQKYGMLQWQVRVR